MTPTAETIRKRKIQEIIIIPAFLFCKLVKIIIVAVISVFTIFN